MKGGKLLMNDKKVLFTILLLATVVIGTSVVTAGFFDSASGNDIVVENITIDSEGYSMYKVSADIIPKKDFTYLEMQVVFYDSNNAVIGKSPLAWNVKNPAKDQKIKASGTALTDDSSYKPARAEVYIVDSGFGDTGDAIFSQNVTM